MDMSAIGFTGTRQGLTPAQAWSLDALLRHVAQLGCRHLHHGCCTGADETAHDLAGQYGIRRTLHPPQDTKLMAALTVDNEDRQRSPLPYLTRNKRIVEETHWLIACPKEPPLRLQRQGGTWHTVRYAQEQGRMVVFVWPDGTIEIDGWRNAR